MSRKIGSCVRGVHEATTTRFKPVLGDLGLHPVLVVVGAGVDVRLGEDHAGQLPRPLDDPLHVDHRGDVAAAMADEDADPRRLVGHVALGRIGLGPDAAAAGLGQQGHRPGRGRAGLHHRVGNVLGLLERAPHEHAGPGGVQRPELVRRGEAPAVEHHSQPLGLLLQAGAGFQAEREHDHVELFLGLLHPCRERTPCRSTWQRPESVPTIPSLLAWTSRKFRVPGIS